MIDKKLVSGIQLVSTLVTFFLGFLVPLLSYSQLFPIFREAPELKYLQPIIIFNGYFTIIIGGILTSLRYIGFYFEKHTLKRAVINFFSALLVLLLLLSNAQLSVVQIIEGGSRFYLDVGGVFLLLIISWLLVTSKTLYEIIEVKITPKGNEMRTIKKVRDRTLIACPNCKYMCKKRWKKCPICDSALYKR